MLRIGESGTPDCSTVASWGTLVAGHSAQTSDWVQETGTYTPSGTSITVMVGGDWGAAWSYPTEDYDEVIVDQPGPVTDWALY